MGVGGWGLGVGGWGLGVGVGGWGLRLRAHHLCSPTNLTRSDVSDVQCDAMACDTVLFIAGLWLISMAVSVVHDLIIEHMSTLFVKVTCRLGVNALKNKALNLCNL